MRLILSSPITGEIPRLKDMLENAGITCVVRNEVSAGLSPEIPISEATPELWIEDDRRLADALAIKQSWRNSPPVSGTPWVCPACGEDSESQFTSCWQCGAPKPS